VKMSHRLPRAAGATAGGVPTAAAASVK
jgi:hypothetical protein